MSLLDDLSPANLIGDFTGSTQQAMAAQAGINAQLGLGNEQLQASEQARTQAVGYATPNASQLAQMGTNLELQNQALITNMQGIDRDNAILDSIDPAIKQAGTEAYNLLTGQASAALKPLQDQQARQRTALTQSLAASLGPDYATSSAGAQALAQFDQNAQLTTSQVQQSTLGQLLGVVQNANMNPVNNASTAFNTLGNLNAQGFTMGQNISAGEVGAIEGTPPAYQNLYTAAGNSNIGQAIQGQGMGNIFNTAAGIGTSYLGANFAASALAANGLGAGTTMAGLGLGASTSAAAATAGSAAAMGADPAIIAAFA